MLVKLSPGRCAYTREREEENINVVNIIFRLFCFFFYPLFSYASWATVVKVDLLYTVRDGLAVWEVLYCYVKQLPFIYSYAMYM